MSSEGQFLGKVFLVTGASSGIGETLVTLLASRGASVTLCGQNEERLDAVRQKCITESGGHAERFAVAQGDLQQAEVRKRCVQTTVEKFGQLDVLVPNAGLNDPNASIFTATEESYDKLMSVNVKSVFFLIQEALQYLEKSKGSIVLTSSISTSIPTSPNIVYPMGKAAVDRLASGLAFELAPKGIRVNAVNPSYVPTRIRRYVADDDAAVGAHSDSFAEIESKRQPLGGRCVTTREIADVIMFLASDNASFVTGHCIPVDGGRRMMGALVMPKFTD